jgi:glycosyltransferase involved in cell wall biosynthesis
VAGDLRRRPRIGLIAWDLGHPEDPATNVFSQIVLRGQGRFEFTVVSRSVHAELRELVEWRRAPALERPFRLRWASFFVTGAVRLRGVDADLVHTWGPAPIVPSQVDIASINMLQAGYHAAAGGRPPGHGLGWRAGRGLKLRLERWSYGRRAALLDVDTPQARAVLERLVPGGRVIVTRRVVDMERFHPDAEDGRRLRRELGAADDDLVVLFVGRDWDLKGLEPAIEGLALARRRGAGALRLWVAGGSDGRGLRRMAARHGVADRVHFLGFRTDVERLYRAADLFLLPTVYEHHSRAAHEAAATEVPVIGTAVGGIAELIEAGAGVAVERSGESVAAALAELAGDPERRARMGRLGRERCRWFTPERSTDRYLDLYDELLAGRGSDGRADESRSTRSR